LFAIDFSNYLVSSIMHFHINLVSQTNKQTNKQGRTTRGRLLDHKAYDDDKDKDYSTTTKTTTTASSSLGFTGWLVRSLTSSFKMFIISFWLLLLILILLSYYHLLVGREVEARLDPTLFRRINEIFCGLRQLWTEGFKEELIKLGKEQQFDILRLMPGCTTTCTKLDTAVAVTDDYARITRSRKRLKYRSNFILIFKCPNFRIDNNLN
jgi:hypothetical protein